MNVKIIIFLVLLPVALWVQLQVRNLSWSKVAPLILVPFGLATWVFLVQQENGSYTLATLQAKDVVSLLTGAWFVSIYCALRPENTMKFIRLVIKLVIATSSLKVIIAVYALATGTDTSSILKQISDVFHVALISYDFDSSELGRVVFYSDGLLPLCIFAVLNLQRRLKYTATQTSVILALFAISTFMTFTRFLWGFSLIALALAFLVTKLGKAQLTFVIVAAVLVLSTLSRTASIVTLRFSADATADSDAARTEQNLALHKFFLDAPVLGHGLGSYTPTLVRSSDAPYSYENQLGALLGQIGVVGCAALGLLLIAYYYKAFLGGSASAKYKIALACLLLFWLYGGFLNPQVISSASSVSFGMILALALVRRKDDASGEKPGTLAPA